MSTVQLTRAQRRQMQKLADRVDRMSQADRRFFERFPHRQHRMRIAGAAEIEHEAILNGALYAPPGSCIYVVVKNVAPGMRLRLLFRDPDGADTDIDEAAARAIFDERSAARHLEVEAEMRRLAEVLGMTGAEKLSPAPDND
jgi:hypothetical protein